MVLPSRRIHEVCMPLSSLYRLSVRTQLLWLLCAAMLPLLGLLTILIGLGLVFRPRRS